MYVRSARLDLYSFAFTELPKLHILSSRVMRIAAALDIPSERFLHLKYTTNHKKENILRVKNNVKELQSGFLIGNTQWEVLGYSNSGLKDGQV